MWKYILILLALLSLGTLGFVLVNMNKDLNDAGIETKTILSPFSKLVDENEEQDSEFGKLIKDNPYPLGKPINILLLGIDRRSRDESAFRTDIMILISINPETNRVVMSSLPRDLWYDGGRLNAIYIQSGWEALQSAVYQITGLKPERFILTDFKDFSWIVDAMGGVPVTVDTTFTDSNYPIDETFEYQIITFTQGPELLTGKRALIYSRSRKGDNGEGSDWMRMRRQHKILVGMLDAVLSPKSLFNPMVVEKAFETVTAGKMDTNLELFDAKYLWDFYKDKDKYTFHSLFLDYEYLYSPPLEEYGGAWVLIPTSGSYKEFHDDIKNKLYILEQPKNEETEDNITKDLE